MRDLQRFPLEKREIVDELLVAATATDTDEIGSNRAMILVIAAAIVQNTFDKVPLKMLLPMLQGVPPHEATVAYNEGLKNAKVQATGNPKQA